MQRAFQCIMHGKCEHANRAPRRGLHAPRFYGSQKNFRVGVRSKRHAQRAQFFAQVLKIINLSVEYQREAAASRMHGLSCSICAVNNF